MAERAETALRSQQLELEHCRCEAGLAERRYRRVDPDNRLIAATLEQDWEAALKALNSAEIALEAARQRQPEAPPPSFFTNLGASMERVRDAPGTTRRDRKRLLACLVEEVVLQTVEEGWTEVIVHWRGGRADAFRVKRRRTKPAHQRDDVDTVEMVRRLAKIHPDIKIAAILNEQGRRSARGLPFSVSLVQSLRRRSGIPAYAKPASEEWEEGELLSVRVAARRIGTAESTLYRWINAGILPCVRPDAPGAPGRIRMGADFLSRFHLDPPEGFVPLREAMDRLGASRRTVWERVKSGRLESRRVKRGAVRGLYIRLEERRASAVRGGECGRGGPAAMRGHSIRPVACRRGSPPGRIPAAVLAARDGGGREICETSARLPRDDAFRGFAAAEGQAIGRPDWHFGAGAGRSHGAGTGRRIFRNPAVSRFFL